MATRKLYLWAYGTPADTPRDPCLTCRTSRASSRRCAGSRRSRLLTRHIKTPMQSSSRSPPLPTTLAWLKVPTLLLRPLPSPLTPLH